MPSRLISTDQLVIRTGQRDVGEITDVLEVMSLAATLYLEGELLTAFDANTATDKFYSQYPLNQDHLTLSLNNGFIDTASVVVSYAASMRELNTNAIVVDPALYDVSNDGLIILYSGLTYPMYYKVSYAYGFTTQAGGLYTVTEVPEWLKELATQYVIYRVNTMSPFRKVQKSEVKSGEPVLLRSMLEAHARVYPHAIKPIL